MADRPTPPDDRAPSAGANPDYALGQLAHVLATAQELPDADTRRRADRRVADWLRVFGGMLCEPSAPPTFTALDVLDTLGSAGGSALTVVEGLDVLLDHELVSAAGEVGGRPVYVVHPEGRPF